MRIQRRKERYLYVYLVVRHQTMSMNADNLAAISAHHGSIKAVSVMMSFFHSSLSFERLASEANVCETRLSVLMMADTICPALVR